MRQKYEMRAAQIDLARQMEPLTFIKAFIDFIAENNYNTLFLYLEWRIRTKTFDIGKDKGYSADEIHEIVDYAELRGIQVIPGLATLGHAELILENEKYAHLAEVRETGVQGRFGGTRHTAFCPSLPEVRTFIKNYLTDVAAIFTKTGFLHVGLDEVWDMNRCSLCRSRGRGEMPEGRFFMEHLKFVHDVCAGLGKRIMMWDDMFEILPEYLKEVPRDVVMVCWLYEKAVSGYSGHIRNQCFSDRLAAYRELGFDYMIAPSDRTFTNSFTFTAYGNRFAPMGALLTTWEKYNSLLFRSFPTIAMAGHLWDQKNADDPERAAADAIRQLFGVDDDPFVQAVITFCSMNWKKPFPSVTSLLCFPLAGPDFSYMHSMRSVLSILSAHSGAMKDTRAEVILTEMLFTLETFILMFRSRIACWNLMHGMKGESLSRLATEVKKTGGDYLQFCISQRNGKEPSRMRAGLRTWCEALKAIEKSVREKSGKLMVLFSLPDYYGVEKNRIYLNGTLLASGIYKCVPDALYKQFFLIPGNVTPRTVTLEAEGYGGTGIAYVSAETEKGSFVPEGITDIRGKINDPSNLLSADATAAFFGPQSIGEAFRDPAAAAAIHGVTLKMKRETL